MSRLLTRLISLSFLASTCTTSTPNKQTTPKKSPDTPLVVTPMGDPHRGQLIFGKGLSPSGANIEAVLKGDVSLDAKAMPCIGCHGEDGRGRPEGGMKPSNITWEALSKPYGGRGQDGRKHIAYDQRSLGKAITQGVDPSGNNLLPAMPRYRMSRQDLADLVAYIEVVGHQTDAGLSDHTIRIATLTPQGDPTGEAIKAVLEAYFAEVNGLGGIYGRKLIVEAIQLPPDRDWADTSSAQTKLAEFVDAHSIFAVLASKLGAAEAELNTCFADLGIPVIGPFSSFPDPGQPPRANVFYVDGGIPAQVLALAEHAVTHTIDQGPTVVLTPDTPPEKNLAQRLITDLSSRGLKAEITALRFDAESKLSDIIDSLKRIGPDHLLVLGPAPLTPKLFEMLATDPRFRAKLTVLIPGSLPIGDPFALPATFDKRILIAYPWTPDDLNPQTLVDYRTLAKRYKLPRTYRPVHFATLTAGKLLIEGLTRAGRSLTRRVLIKQLEGLRNYTTGLTPPLTYGPNKRIGVDVVRLTKVDIQTHRLVGVP